MKLFIYIIKLIKCFIFDTIDNYLHESYIHYMHIYLSLSLDNVEF